MSATNKPIAAAASMIVNTSSIWLMPRRSTVVIELTVCCACWSMFLTIVPSARVAAATRGRGGGWVGGLDEHDVGPAGMVGRLEVGEVGDHERVARGGRELLHDAGDMERHDVEVAGAVVEHAQAQQIAEVELVVADRLLGDEDAVRPCAQPGHVWLALAPRK